MTSTSQCDACIHLDWNAPPRVFRCTAFPDGIPIPIQSNKHDHTKPYPGDTGIRFEQIRPGPRVEVAVQAILERGAKPDPHITTATEPHEPKKRRRVAR